jgi:hypothetical protein
MVLILGISLIDIFRGYAQSYYGFNLENLEEGDTPSTNWTVDHLAYFAKLGQLLGFKTWMEKDNRDLIWFRNTSENPFLHLEHENESKWEKVRDDELSKQLKGSPAEVLIGIFYPPQSDLEDWKDKIRKEMDIDKDMLFILNPLTNASPFELHGLVHEDGKWDDYEAEIHLPPPLKVRSI